MSKGRAIDVTRHASCERHECRAALRCAHPSFNRQCLFYSERYHRELPREERPVVKSDGDKQGSLKNIVEAANDTRTRGSDQSPEFHRRGTPW
jgi:hypothetical protein